MNRPALEFKTRTINAKDPPLKQDQSRPISLTSEETTELVCLFAEFRDCDDPSAHTDAGILTEIELWYRSSE